MTSKIDSSSSFLTIIYSSIFLVITQILLVKLSPQFFSLFNPLPYLIIGLILRYKDLVFSAILSFLLISVLNFFFPERIDSKRIHCFSTGYFANNFDIFRCILFCSRKEYIAFENNTLLKFIFSINFNNSLFYSFSKHRPNRNKNVFSKIIERD